jgi:hypothetical protein
VTINLKKCAAATIFVVVLIGSCLAGCSASSSQNTTSATGQESSPAATGQQSTSQSAQQQKPGSQGQQPPGASNMTEILSRAAEILGISSEKLTTAFQNAMPQGGPSGSGQQGQPSTPPSGQQGEPPAAPSGEQGQPPTPPSGEQGQSSTPPSGQQMTQSQFMTDIYEKMAEELNISADDIASAMQQAEEELQK